MRRLLPVILFAITAGPVLADTPVTGKWICDYGVRNLSSAAQTSSAWFEVTLSEKGKFHGVGKATAGGATLRMIVRGAWSLADDKLSMNGVSDVSNRVVPFRFVTKRIGENRFKNREIKGAAEYRTSCRRDP